MTPPDCTAPQDRAAPAGRVLRAGLAIAAAGLAASMLSWPLAQAATFRIDDSATQSEGQVAMRWRAERAGQRDSAAVDGASRVQVVLNVKPWLGQRGRVYMVLPPQTVGSLVVQWTSRGRLSPGQLRGGQRALVFDGLIDTPLLQDTFDVRVSADGRELAAAQRLLFSFEIDLP